MQDHYQAAQSAAGLHTRVTHVSGKKANFLFTKSSIPLHKTSHLMLIVLSTSGRPQEVSLPCANTDAGSLCAQEKFSICCVKSN